METLIPVNIVIGDRNYRIKIASADEEQVRKTVKTINEKIVEFKTQFAGKDMQDYIAMVLVWYATQFTQENKDASSYPDLGELEKALEHLEQQVKEAL